MVHPCRLLLFDGVGAAHGTVAALHNLGIAVETAPSLTGIGALACRSDCLTVVLCPAPGTASLSAACEACYELAQGGSDVPVLVCCAGPGEADRLALFEAGAEAVVDPGELLEAVLRAIPAELRSGLRQPHGDVYMKAGANELPTVVQFLALSGRRGRLDVTFSAAAGPGQVWVLPGAVVHAEYDGLHGVEALAWMFVMGAAEVRFHEGDVDVEQTIQRAVDSVLIEAAVLADELRAGGGQP